MHTHKQVGLRSAPEYNGCHGEVLGRSETRYQARGPAHSLTHSP